VKSAQLELGVFVWVYECLQKRLKAEGRFAELQLCAMHSWVLVLSLLLLPPKWRAPKILIAKSSLIFRP
jgi:hypothetical protein